MIRSSVARRRLLGAICLGISGGMLILGETLLRDRLANLAFVYYWLVCASFTLLTLIIAVLDLRAVRRRSQQEHAELVREAFRDIAPRAGGSDGSPEKHG